MQVQDQVVKYLSTNKYIKYKAAVDFPKGYKRGDPIDRNWPRRNFAKYGARNVVNGGPVQLLKAEFRKHLDYYDEDDNENHVLVSMINNVMNNDDTHNSTKRKKEIKHLVGIYVCTEKVRVECFNDDGGSGDKKKKTCKNVCNLKWQGSLEPLGS